LWFDFQRTAKTECGDAVRGQKYSVCEVAKFCETEQCSLSSRRSHIQMSASDWCRRIQRTVVGLSQYHYLCGGWAASVTEWLSGH